MIARYKSDKVWKFGTQYAKELNLQHVLFPLCGISEEFLPLVVNLGVDSHSLANREEASRLW